MQAFEHPIDAALLLRKKRRLKKELLSRDIAWIDKRIAVLGGSTTNEICDQLELFLLHHGIRPTFYQSEYGQYWQDAVFSNEGLDAFRPDVVYIHTSWRNIPVFPDTTATVQQANDMLEEVCGHFTAAWEKLQERFGCPIIQDNFDRPAWRLLGNSDISDHRGKTNFIFKLNRYLYDYADSHKGFYVNDVDYLAACFGLEKWANPLYWHMYKYSLCLEAIPALAKSVADIIKSIYGRNKKVIVCDLDNTLWGGVVGDDGPEGIQVGPEVPMGQIYSEFQQYLKEQKSIGVLLAVNSKNDEENAIAGLNHPDGPLKPGDFAAIRANWDNKDMNARSIAEELSLGADSFVFIDDNPVEREIMQAAGLGIAVPVMDKVEAYLQTLDRSGYFEVTSLSDDDLSRAAMYQANAQRKTLMQSAGSYEDFLRSLDMKAAITDFEPMAIQRIAQLTNKSNQFNLTTLRCSEGDIRAMQESENWLCLCGRLQDKFGDNGIVSVVAGEREGDALHLRLWLMSCRVLKRGMEDAMLDTLVTGARARGISTIVGYYYPTAKNNMVRDFYGRMGFALIKEQPDGSTVWALETSAYAPKNPPIEIN
ncbi:MAG: HAD-IIIC family phosphatase [Clostridia bacterium]|nr:HAD-IIIC family phosphatase [Clostridia bacterium]